MAAVSSIPGSHAVYGLNVFLAIEGKEYPIVSTTIEYTLNQIPVAAVTVPCGLKISKDNEEDVSSLPANRRVRAQILISGTGKPHPNNVRATPTGNISKEVLFDGYVAAVHNHISVASVSTTVVLFSWLQDLDISTLASGEFVKTSPNDWFSTSYKQWVNFDADEFPYFKGAQDKLLRRTDIVELDWWEGIIKPGMLYKANAPLNKFVKLSNSRAPNQYIPPALAKIFSNSRLTLTPNAASGVRGHQTVVSQIAKKFTDIVMGSEGGSSAFEKLISLGREFKFVLAPFIKTAKLIEYNPLTKVTHFLKENEFDFGSSTPNPSVVPAAVLLHGIPPNAYWISWGEPSPNEGKVDLGFTGQYPNPIKNNGIATGPFLVVPTPEWMFSPNKYGYGFISSKGLVIRSNSNPNNNSSNTPAGNPNLSKFADAYAASVYFDAIFAAKTQEIVCGFRTDIQPGDCLHMEFSKGISSQNNKFEKRGIVNSVIYVLSGGNTPRINTTYKLRHVLDKSDAEYFDVNMTNGIPHPLFKGL